MSPDLSRDPRPPGNPPHHLLDCTSSIALLEAHLGGGGACPVGSPALRAGPPPLLGPGQTHRHPSTLLLFTIKRYARVWLRLAAMSFAEVWVTRMNSLGWLSGKLVRLVFFFIFIVAIFRHSPTLKGYTLPQAALFFLTFNLVDLVAQLFLRGIYGIKRIVVEGELDYYLLQPINPLFRIASQTVDFLDLITALPVAFLTFWACAHLGADALGLKNILLYLLLLANGVAIAFGIHVAVAALAVATQQLENTIWVYRDLMILGRFPIDIYSQAMRLVLTFVIPIAVMTSFPAKALLGVLSWPWVFFGFGLAFIFVLGSLRLWAWCLSRYSSVSS